MTQEFNFTESVDGSFSSTIFFDDTLDGGVSSSTSFTVTLDGGRSNVNRIKNKISSIVSKQLPEFIPEEYPTFVAFLEAYYRFLEQNKGAAEILQNSSSYLDIDRTTPEFVKYLLLNYTKDFPITTLANKPFLIKKIKDLYESKGSELSFKLLFRLIYQTDVEVSYPYENVLIPSNGVWTKKVSIRVQRIFGDLNSLINRLLVYTSPSGVISYTKILDYKVVKGDYVEIFLDINTLAQNYNYGRDVFVYTIDPTTTRPTDNDIAFKGVVSPYVTDYTILKGGAGFKVNTVFELVYNGGNGTLVKISKVSSTGAIEGLEFIRYGTEYPTDEIEFIINLDPENITVTTLPADIFSSSTYGFTDSGQIVKTGVSYIPLYFAEDYTSSEDYLGEVIRTFAQSQFNSNTIFAGQIEPRDEIAIINFSQSDPLITYPGYYTDSKGFLSESDIVLQDGEVHQAFAYRTTTTLDVSLFYDVVKSLIHPAGLQLFNNFIVDSTLDISNSITSTNVTRANVIFEAHDSAVMSDFSQIGYQKNVDVADFFVYPISEITNKIITKVIIDGINTSEFNFYSFTKFIVDQAEVVDSEFFTLQTIINDESITNDEQLLFVNKSSEDLSNVLDEQSLNYQTQFSDDTNEFEDNNILSVNLVQRDDLFTSDTVSIGKLFLRDVDDTVDTQSFSTITFQTSFDDIIADLSDNNIISTNVVLTEDLDLLDSTDVSTSLNLVEILQATEEILNNVSFAINDQNNANDNGLLERIIINTDYATDYFAEEYIYSIQETRDL